MSQSPLERADPDAGAAAPSVDPYRSAWSAINKLMRRGYSWSGREQNCAFLNLGPDTRFADVSAASGFDFPDDARALALVDWDGDGDQDVVVANRTGPRVRFLRNDQATGHAWLTLELRGTRANRDAIGARVELRVRDAHGRDSRLVRAVRAGEGYLSQSSSRLTIGLGAGPVTVLEAAVAWPGGAREPFTGVKPAKHNVLVEGTGEAVPGGPRQAAARALAAGATSAPPATLTARVVLTRPVPLPRLGIETPDGQTLDLFGIDAGGVGRGTGRIVWLSLFSTRCAPCARELALLAEHAAALADGGVACLALCVDPPAEPDAQEDEAQAFLERAGWPLPWAHASPAAIEALDGLQGALLDRERRLPLPSSFLVDAAGALRVLYVGPVEPQTLLADRELCELGESALLEASTPFEGRWMFPLSVSDADFLEGRLTARGLPGVAAEYARGRLDVVRSSRADLLFDFGRRAAGEGRFEEALDFYRRCLEVEPDHFGALFDAAVVNQRLERPSEAVELYRLALAARPGHLDTQFNLALALLGAGRVDEVEPLRRQVEEKDAQAGELLERAVREWREAREKQR